MKYKKTALLPNLAINNFALETPEGRMTVKKWKKVPFTVEQFSFEEYCQEHFPDMFDWDTNKRICAVFLSFLSCQVLSVFIIIQSPFTETVTVLFKVL